MLGEESRNHVRYINASPLAQLISAWKNVESRFKSITEIDFGCTYSSLLFKETYDNSSIHFSHLEHLWFAGSRGSREKCVEDLSLLSSVSV